MTDYVVTSDGSARAENIIIYRQWYESDDKGYGLANLIIDRLAGMAFAKGYNWISNDEDPIFPVHGWGTELGLAGDLFLLTRTSPSLQDENLFKIDLLPAEAIDIIVDDNNEVIGYGYQWQEELNKKMYMHRIEYRNDLTRIFDPLPMHLGTFKYKFTKFNDIPNELGINPVVHIKNIDLPSNMFGVPDLSAPIQSIDTAEDQIETAEEVNRYNAKPKRVVGGVTPPKGKFAADVYGFEGSQVIYKPDGTTVELLTWDNNLKATFELLDKSIDLAKSVAGIIDIPADKELSGRALGILARPMIDVADGKRKNMLKGIDEIIVRKQLIDGMNYDYEITWPRYFEPTIQEIRDRYDLLKQMKNDGVIDEAEFNEQSRDLL